jgi:hypothetical protein
MYNFDEHVHHFDQPRLVVFHDEPRFVLTDQSEVSQNDE